MTDAPGGAVPADEDADEYETETRWLTWREAAGSRAARRSAGEADAAQDAEEIEDPFRSRRAFREWSVESARSLLDVQVRRPATRTLLPLAYVLSVASFGIGLPIVLVVLAWKASVLLGILAALVAIPLGVTFAAAVRLMLEFADNAALLARRVEHISDLADDLFQALSDVAEPVNQLSEDVRAVQFWRFRKKSSRK